MIAEKITRRLGSSSLIRAMFEEGEKLRKIYGKDKVYDFSLGNPDLEPPQAVKDTLKKLILEDVPDLHKYMSNAGFADVREKVASHLSRENGIPLSPENIVMTSGAAGGLNVILMTLLDPDQEVIVFSPYFVDYLNYIENFGGKAVIVPTNKDTFEPDPELLKTSITPRTKAVIINSPNNPTGVIYSEEVLKRMARVLEDKEKEYNTTIYVISDEPYNRLVFDGFKVPGILKIFKNSLLVNSFSKSLALPGERIGYIAASSAIDNVSLLINGLIYVSRVLGFINAPSLFQKVVAESLEVAVDTEIYRERRDILYNHLTELGFSCVKPHGTFYLFPKSLIEDDGEFVRRAMKYNLLFTPGKGFGCPGYFRIAYCVSMETIKNSLPAFEALAKEFKG
ncbi:MAG: pyridoxal phosphate-dependent aminotransferase [Clostridiales bacterium]|jgi:aspartate aminotransferase|nr:pyridoxal phosphate-dependent aminotransferase [Eubacteriales bacterium]MDH7565789.1 pyridoxal phosphate-dependent aminotransferase [Clostridiales bacterium]